MEPTNFSEDNIYGFNLSGTFSIDQNVIREPIFDCYGNTIGFINNKGQQIKLIVGLEIIDESNSNERDVTNGKEMEAEGFELIMYDESSFEPPESI